MRIRTIKPVKLDSQKLQSVPIAARYLFDQLLMVADDEGRFRAVPVKLRNEIFKYDPPDAVSVDDVAGWLAALCRLGLLTCYEIDGERFACFPGFREHQVVNRPRPSELPPPPIDSGCIPDSPTTHGGLSEASVGEWKGMEGKGTEGKPARNPGAPPRAAVSVSSKNDPDPTHPIGLSDVPEVAAAWNDAAGYMSTQMDRIGESGLSDAELLGFERHLCGRRSLEWFKLYVEAIKTTKTPYFRAHKGPWTLGLALDSENVIDWVEKNRGNDASKSKKAAGFDGDAFTAEMLAKIPEEESC